MLRREREVGQQQLAVLGYTDHDERAVYGGVATAQCLVLGERAQRARHHKIVGTRAAPLAATDHPALTQAHAARRARRGRGRLPARRV